MDWLLMLATGAAAVWFYTQLQQQKRITRALRKKLDSLPEHELTKNCAGVFVNTQTGEPWVFNGSHAWDNEYSNLVKILAMLIKQRDSDFFSLIISKAPIK